MTEERQRVTGASQEGPGTSANVLYSAELVYEGGIFTLNVRDRINGTLRSTAVPRQMVRKIPKYLSMINFE